VCLAGSILVWTLGSLAAAAIRLTRADI
jgi:hypothetical protein